MAKNMMGVGIAYTGQDSGWTKAATQAAESVGYLVGAFKGIKDSIVKPLTAVKDRISSLVSALPENLTTSYEAQLVEANKSGRALAAQLGYGSKQMGAFSAQAFSLGRSLNLSTEEAGKAIFAWDRGSDVLKSIGIDSAETAAKVQRVFGLDMSQFVMQLKSAKKTMGLTDEQLKRITDSTLAWGQQSGDVNKALSGMAGQFDHLKEKAHSLGKTLSSEELTQFAESSNKAKQLLMAMGSTAEDAEASVGSMQTTFMAADKNMGGMFAGVTSNLTEFQEEFAILGVNIGDQFDLMKQGPAGFIQGLSTATKRAGGWAKMTDDQQSFIKQRLLKGIGDPKLATQIFNVFEQGGDALDAMVAKLPKATEDIGKLAKAADRTGYTLAQRMEMAREEFTAGLRSTIKDTMGWVKTKKGWQMQMMSADAAFLGANKKGLDEYGAKLKGMAAQDGPIGMFGQALIKVQKYGAAGLVPPEWAGEFEIFKKLGADFGPVLTGLSQMLPLLTLLVSPVGLLLAAFAGLAFWFMSVRKEGDSFGDTLGRMGGQALEFLTVDLPAYLGKGFDWVVANIVPLVEPAFDALAKFLFTDLPPMLSKAFGFAFNWLFKTLLPWLGPKVQNLVSGLGQLLAKYLPVAIKALLNGVDWLFTELPLLIIAKLVEYAPSILEAIKNVAVGGLDLLKGAVLGIFEGIRQYLVEKFPEAAKTITTVFEGIKTVVMAVFDGVKAQVVYIIGIAKDLFGFVGEAIDFWSKKLGKAAPKSLVPAGVGVPAVPPSSGTILSGFSTPTTSGSPTPAKKALPSPLKPAPAVSVKDRDASLVAAIHAPNWYSRYEQVFTARMQALEMAVATGAGPKGGNIARGKPKSGAASNIGTNGKLGADMAGSPSKAE
jgi:phage-related protein